VLWACFGKPFLRIVQWLTRSEVVFQDRKIVPVGVVWLVTVPFEVLASWRAVAECRGTSPVEQPVAGVVRPAARRRRRRRPARSVGVGNG